MWYNKYENILGKGADNVQSLDNEKMYTNILASALCMVQQFDEIIGEIDAVSNYSKYTQYIKDKLDSILDWEDKQFLDDLNEVLKEIEASEG